MNQEVEAGQTLKVRIRSIKDRAEARYVTVEWKGAIATFRFSKANNMAKEEVIP